MRDISTMIKVLTVIGTRPEAVKLAPVIKELQRQPQLFRSVVCATGQHEEILYQTLRVFSIQPEYDLKVMKPHQDLFDITTNILLGLQKVLYDENPDWVLVQGDTTTAVSASLAAYYFRIKIGHIEAGLRTYNKYAPFPEEMNRHIIDVLSDLLFVPTAMAKNNLLQEGIPKERILLTGNTVIDALQWMVNEITHQRISIKPLPVNINWNVQTILVTAHRRESFGLDLRTICHALRQIATHYPNINIVFPVHPNPSVQEPVIQLLGNCSNIYLIAPQSYETFVWLMTQAYLILTDSGGVQEEAPALGKPVLVIRRVTERPEGVRAGAAKLINIEQQAIFENVRLLLEDKEAYAKMAQMQSPYGDGDAARRIVDLLYSFT
jgi:UDP-N-acetylglucosamine 2-epimerase (non-hydrolysing)